MIVIVDGNMGGIRPLINVINFINIIGVHTIVATNNLTGECACGTMVTANQMKGGTYEWPQRDRSDM